MGTTADTNCFGGKRLLWIDDRVSIHRSLIARIRDYGVHVATTETVDDGLAELGQSRFDRVLLDAMIGHESALPEIPRILQSAQGAQLSVCSGFMYRDFLQKQRDAAESEMGVQINTIDKEVLPEANEPESVEEFLGILFKGASSPGETISLDAEPTSLSLSYNDYARLGLEDKMKWLDDVEPLVAAVADRYFADGYAYVLFCGSDQPVLECAVPSEIPSEEEVIRLARNAGYAPFAIHNIGTVDDVPAACCDRSGLRSYPTLKLSAVEAEEAVVHFDNGTSQSLMSYEWYGEKGWIPYARVPDLLRVGEMVVKGVRYKIESCDFTDADEVSIRASFYAYYIMQWDECRLAIPCGPACANTWRLEPMSQNICRFRTGLLGRTLPRDELKVNFVVDFVSGNIRFVKL